MLAKQTTMMTMMTIQFEKQLHVRNELKSLVFLSQICSNHLCDQLIDLIDKSAVFFVYNFINLIILVSISFHFTFFSTFLRSFSLCVTFLLCQYNEYYYFIIWSIPRNSIPREKNRFPFKKPLLMQFYR